MDLNTFSDSVERIFAIFNKKMPDDRVIETIYKRVKDLPSDFMDFAVRHFEDQENLPRNLGRYLYRELWPEYLSENPENRAHVELCPNCLPEMPGYRKVWRKESYCNGEKEDWFPLVIRCSCGIAPNPRKDPVYSDRELLDMGLSLDRPPLKDFHRLPFEIARALGHIEKQRPDHLQILEAMEF